MKIHLGVVDIPYVNEPLPTKKPRKKPVKVALETTGEIAEILEDKYHVMEHFVQLHGEEIGDALEDGLSGAIETLLMGGQPPGDLYVRGASKIEELFRRFLESQEMDSLGYPGIPTRAAIEGVSHRFKRRRGPPRPSFVDTSQYELSFKLWVDD